MTKEIWAAVIICGVQILVSITLTWWQIQNAKTLSDQEKLVSSNIFKKMIDRLFELISIKPIHIMIPFIVFAFGIVKYIYLYGFNTITTFYMIAGFTIFAIQIGFWSLSKMIQTLSKAIIKHDARITCHDSIIFDLTDRPCKDDNICKFKV